MQMKYPSALTSFEKITSYAKGKKIALFLDYDGTLSPIVSNPDRAFMSSAVSRDMSYCFSLEFWSLVLNGNYRALIIIIFPDADCCEECCEAFSNSYYQWKMP